MKIKKIMLPHWVQPISAAVAACGLAAMIASAMFEPTSATAEITLFFGYWALFFGLIATVFAREKTEDEFIDHLRLASIFRVTVCYVLWSVFAAIGSYLLPRMLTLETMGQVAWVAMWPNGAIFWILLYLVLFKGAIFANSRREGTAA